MLSRRNRGTIALAFPTPARRLRRGAHHPRRHRQAVHQHRPDAGRRRWTARRTSSSTGRCRTSRASTRRRDQAQHRPRRAASGRVGRDHEVGRGRQEGDLLPQRRRERDVHRHIVVPGLPAGRVVGHVPRRAVPAPQLRRQGREVPGVPRRHARRQGSRRAVHGGRRQGGDPQEDRPHPAAEGEPQDPRLQPEARLRRLGRRGHPPARGHARLRPLRRRSPKLDAEAQSVTTVDFDSDGKPDICLCGASKVVLLQNGGDGFIETALPGSHRRLRAPRCGPTTTATACPTCCSPRRPARGCSRTSARASSATTPICCRRKRVQPHRRRLGRLRRRRQARHPARQRLPRPAALQEHAPGDAEVVPPKFGDWHSIGMFRAANPADNFKTEFPIEKEKFNEKKTYKGKRDIDTAVEEDAVQGRRGREPDGLRAELRELRLSRDRGCRPTTDLPVDPRQPTTRSPSGSTARRCSADNGTKPVDRTRASSC